MEAVTHAPETTAGTADAARSAGAWAGREPWLAVFADVAAGRREALARLYDMAASRVFGLALWRTGSADDAAEVVQEVLVRVAEQRDRLSTVADPRWWLLAVTHRIAVDVVRRRRRRVAEPLEEHPHLESPSDDPDRRIDAARARALLSRLSPKQREVLFLHHVAEMSFAEIGRTLGVPTFTAASRHRLGLAALRRLLESGS